MMESSKSPLPLAIPLILLVSLPTGASPPASRPSADEALAKLRKGHPRLILTEERLAELKRLMAGDKLLQKCHRDVLEQAGRAGRRRPLPYQKRGPRLLHVSRDCLGRTYALALAWRLTGKRSYADKGAENLLTVCDFPDWNPRHFLDVAEMAHAVGIGYDWLFDALDETARRRIRSALIGKGLKPGLEIYRRGGWWAKSAFNWNQVCNGGMVLGALAIAETDPEYAEAILPQAVASLPKALANYAPDGAWPEGPGYWGYATRYTVFALAAMQTALGTDFGLSQARGLDRAGAFPLYACGPTGLYVNFADVGDNSRRRNIPSLFWLARRYGAAELAEAECEMISRRRADPLDFIWYVPPGGKKADPPALDKLFRGPVELAVFRSAWGDPEALFLAVKAGDNQINHGHLDLGNFELDALGVRWARDLGSDDYNLPGYWAKGRGGRRWSYYRLGSLSHNVPILAGQNQRAVATARMVKFQAGPARPQAVVDLTSAYKPLAGKVSRGVALVAGRRAALVQDELEIAKACEVAWGMTTDAAIEVDRARARLTLRGKALEARILSPAGAAFTVESAEQKPPQKTNKGVKRLMIRLPERSGRLRIAVLLAPLWPEGPAASIPEITPLAQW